MHRVNERKITRRALLVALGAAGGAGLTLGAMEALGLLPPVGSTRVDFRPPARSDFTLTGRASASVIVLGAGIAGLTTAYELEKAGYRCTILEARDRPGGRNWTVRGGTRETALDGSTQTARFDKGMHANLGPTRIAQHHTTMDYCRELGVPVHVFGNQNADAFYYFEDAGVLSGRRLRHRAVQADLRGYVSELLAKAVSQGAVDADVSIADREVLLDYLRTTGFLNEANRYVGGSARGYATGASANPPVAEAGFALRDLLEVHRRGLSTLGIFATLENDWDGAMPMFEPDGGMDRIPMALAAAVKGTIRYGAEVIACNNEAGDVRVRYRDGSGEHEQTADYCVCALPPHILARVTNNFAKETSDALRAARPLNAGKMGLQFKRRFWEEDDRIFGGVTLTNMDITQILYPSEGYFGAKGVLIGYYALSEFANAFGVMHPDDRTARALLQGVKVHGEVYRTEFESSFSADWRGTRFSEGAWVIWPGQVSSGGAAFDRLQRPEGRVYFAGDHLSYAIGWQHGAFESARQVVMDLHKRVLAST